MRRFLTLHILLSLLLLTGCRQEEAPLYSGFEMGWVRQGAITTDQQVKLAVRENPSDYDLTTERRVMARYQTFSKDHAGAYQVDLQELWETQVLPPLPASEPTGLITDTPVLVDDAWFSGGYLNAHLRFHGTEMDRHRFQLVFSATNGRMHLRLYHDDQEQTQGATLLHTYLCFPLDRITATFRNEVAADAKIIPLLLQWTGYALDDHGNPTGKAEPRSQEGNYRP